MTISNYCVREYLHLYHEYRKVINIFDAFLLYGKIEYTLGELRRDFHLTINFTVPFMIGSLIFPVVLAESSANLILRMISDYYSCK